MAIEVVNLRIFRKRKSRATAAQAAAENRLVHGRSAAEKKQAALERRRSDAKFAGHERGPAANPGENCEAAPAHGPSEDAS